MNDVLLVYGAVELLYEDGWYHFRAVMPGVRHKVCWG